jgi:hypothetical protein
MGMGREQKKALEAKTAVDEDNDSDSDSDERGMDLLADDDTTDDVTLSTSTASRRARQRNKPVKTLEAQFPMYPYIETKRQYDAYGEVINPADYQMTEDGKSSVRAKIEAMVYHHQYPIALFHCWS